MPRPKSTDIEATREVIATVAEDLFRTVGYNKTTLADIAARLSMSTANIYRFFRSKLDINGFICHRLISEYEAAWQGALRPRNTATANLVAFFTACHRHGRSHFLSNQGVYDMIEAAIEQHWPVMRKHMDAMTGFIAAIVETGVQNGEFQHCDARHVAALFILAAHPFLDPRRVRRALLDCETLGLEDRMEKDLQGIISLLARGLSPSLTPLALE